MIKQGENIMIAKELGTFHAVEKMYYKHIALYLLESDLDKNYCIIVDENLTVIQKNVRSFFDFALDLDSPVSEHFNELVFTDLEKEMKQLNIQCLNNEFSYDELVQRVNKAITHVAREIYKLALLNSINDMQVYFLNAILQSIINEAFTDVEAPYPESREESDDENY